MVEEFDEQKDPWGISSNPKPPNPQSQSRAPKSKSERLSQAYIEPAQKALAAGQCDICLRDLKPGVQCSCATLNNNKTTREMPPKIGWGVSSSKREKPVAHIYTRVSTIAQAEGGVSLDAQDGRCFAFAEEMSDEFEDIVTYREEGVSAFAKPILQRPQGRELAANLRSGDTVLIWSVDRAFRSIADYADTYRAWARMGIKLVIVQTQTVTGDGSDGEMYAKFMSGMIAQVAELESNIKSSRIRNVKQEMARQGIPHSSAAGFKIKKINGRSVYVIKPEERFWMKMMYRWRILRVSQKLALERLELMVARRRKDKDPLGRYEKRRGTDGKYMKRRWKETVLHTRVRNYCSIVLGKNPKEVFNDKYIKPGEEGQRIERHTKAWWKLAKKLKDADKAFRMLDRDGNLIQR